MTREQLNEILEQHQLWLNTKGVEGKRADLRGADLRCSDLRYLDLRGVDLSYSNLKGAFLIDAVLIDAVLRGAVLIDADLEGSVLIDADLSGSNLRCADLSGVDLKNANLKGSNLGYINLIDADLEGTGVYFFRGPRHYGIYNLKDDKLFIGCQVHSLDYWLEKYVAIGKKNKYTNKEIEVYGTWIKSLKELT